MHFIRLPKLIDIAERKLPELVADWMNTKSVQNINISFVQKLWLNMLISAVIECSTSWMPHQYTFRNFTPQAWAICNLSNHDVFMIIHDPGPQMRITLSWESISTISFQAGASYVKIPEWGLHSSNLEMPCLVSILGTFWGIWNQPNQNPAVLFWCTAHIFSNIANCEIQQPDMLIARKIGEVSLVRCTNDWHKCRSSRKLIPCIPPPVMDVQLTIYCATFWVCEAPRFKIKVLLKCEMCQIELYIFENILVV